MKKYNPPKIEPKWQKIWQEKGVYEVDLDRARKPFYNLMMFPYPSAEGLHCGNMYAFTGADIYGRFTRMQGFDVFEPMGLDGFGIHSENYALSIGQHPAKLAKITEKNFYRQLHEIGNGYSWKTALETYDPDYYQWTQWIFVKLFKAGLVERKKAAVNWCPSCKTTLSDEQVIGGACERCKTLVEKRELEQWFFKITKYAERLLKNLDWIDWSERTKIAQRNWIGKSEGVEEYWQVEDRDLKLATFTTWPHTSWGATFIVVAPEHPVIEDLVRGTKYEKGAKEFCKQVIQEKIKDFTSIEKEKKGFFIGKHAINHLTGERMKIFIANFVVMSYGTGIVKGCPAHDQRDWEFAKKYNLKIKPVIKGEKMINAGPFTGMDTKKAREAITDHIVKEGNGKRKVNYKLRDWCISRQRYWGPPIPMINCPKCGWLPVPEKDLPVKLPYIENYQPKGKDSSPLAQCEDWVKVACPKCGGASRRETDVSDTFLDSAWYFFRYLSTDKKDQPFDKNRVGKWLPVDIYIGGQEHACLHLMYTRFLTMAFKDMGLIDFEEPFKRFYAHGLLISEGAKMSKSRGNIIIPDKYIKKFGADTLRCYLMFLGPFNQGGDFRDQGIAGMYRFLNRVWRLATAIPKESRAAGKAQKGAKDAKLERLMHQTIKKVTNDIKKLKFNTALAAIMELVNAMSHPDEIVVESLLLLLAPFAPHMTEELWCKVLGKEFSIHHQPWPKYEPKLAREEMVTIVVQVNGKLRERLNVKTQISKVKSEIEKLAKKSIRVQKHLKGKRIKKVVFVPGRLINFVTR